MDREQEISVSQPAEKRTNFWVFIVLDLENRAGRYLLAFRISKYLVNFPAVLIDASCRVNIVVNTVINYIGSMVVEVFYQSKELIFTGDFDRGTLVYVINGDGVGVHFNLFNQKTKHADLSRQAADVEEVKSWT